MFGMNDRNLLLWQALTTADQGANILVIGISRDNPIAF